MLDTTIAGSLPRPAWLAEPETLKGAWKLAGKALEEGKRARRPSGCATRKTPASTS